MGQAPGDAVLLCHPESRCAVIALFDADRAEITQPWLQRLLGMWGMQLSRLKVTKIIVTIAMSPCDCMSGDVWCR